jgi:hypothetical protein
MLGSAHALDGLRGWSGVAREAEIPSFLCHDSSILTHLHDARIPPLTTQQPGRTRVQLVRHSSGGRTSARQLEEL